MTKHKAITFQPTGNINIDNHTVVEEAIKKITEWSSREPSIEILDIAIEETPSKTVLFITYANSSFLEQSKLGTNPSESQKSVFSSPGQFLSQACKNIEYAIERSEGFLRLSRELCQLLSSIIGEPKQPSRHSTLNFTKYLLFLLRLNKMCG